MYIVDSIYLNKQTYDVWNILKDNYIEMFASYDSKIIERFEILTDGNGKLILEIDMNIYDMHVNKNNYSLTNEL